MCEKLESQLDLFKDVDKNVLKTIEEIKNAADNNYVHMSFIMDEVLACWSNFPGIIYTLINKIFLM